MADPTTPTPEQLREDAAEIFAELQAYEQHCNERCYWSDEDEQHVDRQTRAALALEEQATRREAPTDVAALVVTPTDKNK